MTTHPVKVVVLMGGPSEEHEISLKSGHGVAHALSQQGFLIEPVVIPKTLSLEEASRFAQRVLPTTFADVVFLALHGTFGEDGTIQQLCEQLQLPYTGSDPSASRLGMDKVASRVQFEGAGLPVPRWTVMELARDEGSLPKAWSYPVVVKPVNQGSSVGVTVVRQARDFTPALAEAGRYGPQALVEEFIEGREVTVGILGDEPLPVVEIRPRQPFFDFTAKYTPGSTDYLVPAPLEPEVAKAAQAVAHAAHQALGCRHLSRADLILNASQTPVLLEVNTIPGFTPTSLLPKAAACVGISYGALCGQLVHMALRDAAKVALSPS